MRRRPVSDLLVDGDAVPTQTFGRRSFVRRGALGLGTALVIADAAVWRIAPTTKE